MAPVSLRNPENCYCINSHRWSGLKSMFKGGKVSDLQAITTFSGLRIFSTRHFLSLSKTMYAGRLSWFPMPWVRKFACSYYRVGLYSYNVNEQTINEQSFHKIQLQQSCSYLLQCSVPVWLRNAEGNTSFSVSEMHCLCFLNFFGLPLHS